MTPSPLTIPYGFCHCGCGQKTTICKRTSRLHGRQRGEPNPRVQGHGDKLRHGHRLKGKPSRTYTSWRAMIERCTYPGNVEYFRYAGAGVTICERWFLFDNFLADMGERPPGKTIDRFPNPAGNYEPSNCRWATPHEQNMNRRPRLS